MPNPTLKDLRTTYRVLTHIAAVPVANELLVYLAEQIQATEQRKLNNRISRMTEEDLIRYQEAPRHRIRINLPDGRIIQEKTNEQTFYMALIEAGIQNVHSLGIVVRGRPLLVQFGPERRQFNGHKLLAPGYFVVRGVKPAERLQILRQMDERLRLNWAILLV